MSLPGAALLLGAAAELEAWVLGWPTGVGVPPSESEQPDSSAMAISVVLSPPTARRATIRAFPELLDLVAGMLVLRLGACLGFLELRDVHLDILLHPPSLLNECFTGRVCCLLEVTARELPAWRLHVGHILGFPLVVLQAFT
ncbi:hypothetical protein ACFSVJ_15645 [Prauserella oleivorans]